MKPPTSRQKRFDKAVAGGLAAFANHVAVLTGTPGAGPCSIVWSRPGTSNYWMDILIFRGAVFVRGDLGEAVYVWNNREVAPEFLLGCSFDYFHGKCEASEKGRRPMDWSVEAALEWLDDQRADLPDADPDCDLAKFDELAGELRGVAHDRQEWERFVHEHYYEEIQDVFGQDAWECGVWNAGDVPMRRSILHWLGLRMALEALGYGGKKEA